MKRRFNLLESICFGFGCLAVKRLRSTALGMMWRGGWIICLLVWAAVGETAILAVRYGLRFWPI